MIPGLGTGRFDMVQRSIAYTRSRHKYAYYGRRATIITSEGSDLSRVKYGLGSLKDPANNLAFEAHVYFDKDASGTQGTSYEEEECYPEKGIDRVKPFVEWIKQNKFHGFIGEYGIPDNDPRWNETLDLFLGYLQENGINIAY